MAAVAEPEYVALDDWPAEVAPIRRRLYERFGGTLPPATIDDSIATAVARFEGCRITTFVPIFVSADVDVEHYFSNSRIERQAREAIRAVLSFERADFGQTIYLSKFFEAVESIDGVAGLNITEFAVADQEQPVQALGKIQLSETQVASVPALDLPRRAGWDDGDVRNGVRVTVRGGFR